ncbi:MAG: cytochrome bd-I oxidase subunit CydX [Geminicoccaceae bacterium]|nr:cytochrome bd-I oxidase subunit CydX [Geminicoccaceae bacterium]MCB9945221.1 cytochrome bd-I oxidase subunit CydX [Geminicoccaceae bacterium]
MWYFAWALGLPLAVVLAVMNAIWLETKEDERRFERLDANEGKVEG